ncbi:thiamine pyrophosphate-dependent dehydrogenase E1 component subunit alpha [Azospirillum griseum]|nr:thiamine pyrophosphate-dependent dehydrogenase E1 component subunit alpha [Azospirillum griseum]
MTETLDRFANVRLALHHSMLYVRLVEEAIAARYAEQEMRCPVHLSIGQEAAAVGVCHALSEGDRVFSTHRSHAHYLAMNGDLDAMIAEMHGKTTGCIGGRGGSMHLQAPERGLIASVPIVGGSIPLATGTALSDSLDGNRRVSVAFFGDATLEEGVFHESANFAVLRSLPVLFVCENNLYSVYTPLKERQPARPLADVAHGHGLSAETVDGNDAEAVLAAAGRAVERARAGTGPTLLVLDTYRWREHCGPNFDNHLGYRTEAEYLAWREKCPLERSRARLFDRGLLSAEAEQSMIADLTARIEAAFDAARAAPLPDPATAALHVYA